MPDQPPRPQNEETSGNEPSFQDEFSSLGASMSPLNKPEDREEWLADLMGRQSAPAANTGGTIMVENYMDLNPQMREDVDMVLSLIEREVKSRLQRGEKPDINEYLRRFPSQEREIRALFDRVQAAGNPQRDTAQSLERNTPPRYESSMGVTAPPGPPQPMPSRRGGPSSMSSMASVHVMQCARNAGYDILSELGRGGMGVVYKAQQLGLKRMVALKMILAGAHASAEQMARFRAEAEAVAKLQHPNIVQVYDVGEIDGNPFLALEFVDGGSLEDKLKGQPMPPLQAAMLVEPLARAAHVAHQLSIVHRDLKPANILLTSDGTPKISDFGLAKHMDDSSGWTRTGDIMGTPCYMAPEQAEGKIKKIGGPTDVYSLGAILYELLTSRPPFLGSSTLETLEQVRSQDPFPVSKFAPNVPRDLETITMKCLEKEPKDRYESGDALADDLKRFLCDEPILAKPPGMMTRFSRWSKRNPTGAVALVSFILLLVVAGAAIPLLMKEGPPKDDPLARKEPTKPTTMPPKETASGKPSETGMVPRDTSPPPRETAPIKPSNSGSIPIPTTTPTRVEPIPTKPPPPPDYPALLKMAHAAKSPKEAVEHFIKALNCKEGRPQNQTAIQQYSELIAPALKRAAELPPQLPRHLFTANFIEGLAELHATKGELIVQNVSLFEDAGTFTSDPRREARSAFSSAIEIYNHLNKSDQRLAGYYASRGLAIIAMFKELKESDPERTSLLQEIRDDARVSVELAPMLSGGWYLQGFSYHVQPKATKVPIHQAIDLHNALGAYSKAIAHSDAAKDPRYATYHFNRSDVFLNLGRLTMDSSVKQTYYDNAHADAKEAAGAKGSDRDFYGQAILGGINERLGDLGTLRNYQLAIDAYKMQQRAWESKPDGLANQGRVQAKWALADSTKSTLATEAVDSLHKASLKDRRKEKEADISYWNGRLLLAKGEIEKANPKLQVAFDDAQYGTTYQRDFVSYYSKDPAQLRKLLTGLLPSLKECQPKHAYFLMERAKLRTGKELTDDLRKDRPEALEEARTVLKLTQDRQVKLDALNFLFLRLKDIVRDSEIKSLERKIACLNESTGYLAQLSLETIDQTRWEEMYEKPLETELKEVKGIIKDDVWNVNQLNLEKGRELRRKYLRDSVVHLKKLVTGFVDPQPYPGWKNDAYTLMDNFERLGDDRKLDPKTCDNYYQEAINTANLLKSKTTDRGELNTLDVRVKDIRERKRGLQ